MYGISIGITYKNLNNLYNILKGEFLMTRVFIKPSGSRMNYTNALDEFFGNFQNDFELPFPNYPKVDINRNEDSVNVIAELPGVNKSDMKIVLKDGVLTLSGEKKNQNNDKESSNVYRSERIFRKFERKFKLPDDIDPDKVTAKFENGLLDISIAILTPEEPKEKIIEVK